jgi:glycosyltransferase involved in cell wall biosynthesis
MSEPRAILFGPLPPPYGGVAVFMTSVKEACLVRDVEVWSYAGDGDDARVVRVDHRRLGHIRRLLKLPRRTRILDSTHFHVEYPHWLLLVLWLLAKRFKKFTWIKACHDGSLPFRYPAMTAAQKSRIGRAVAKIDSLIVSSVGLANFFREQYGVTATYRSPLMPLPENWADSAHRTRDHREVKVVTSIGAFISSYGFDHVAKAVERLRESGVQVTLTLLDGTFARDEDYKRDVLAGRPWITVHENIPHPEVGKFLVDSDVFVRAFAHESYGLSRVEAIMCGVPVIATNIGETRGMQTYDFGDINTLVIHLEAALSGHMATDLTQWQQVYTHEANANLTAYLHVILGETDA